MAAHGSSHKKGSMKKSMKGGMKGGSYSTYHKQLKTPGNYSGTVQTRHWGGVKGSVSSKMYG